jgi:DNA ligase-1
MFQRTVGIVRRQDKTDLWNRVRFLIFDAPNEGGGFEQRLRAVERLIRSYRPPYARAHQHTECIDADHLRRELAHVEALGGEGLMFRQPGSHYEAGRSATLLKVKTFADAEACVVGHEPGKGRHKGRLGALLAELPNGVKFAVGTGLSDAERNSPPPVGSTITFRYQELTDSGVPRFPSYVGVRAIAPPNLPRSLGLGCPYTGSAVSTSIAPAPMARFSPTNSLRESLSRIIPPDPFGGVWYGVRRRRVDRPARAA